MAQFIGYPGIEQVPQPEGTELCFASIVSAMTGADIYEADKVLKALDLYDEEDRILPMGETRLRVAEAVLNIEPLADPFRGPNEPEQVMDSIDEQFLACRAVALLHKKNDDLSDDRHHWSLLAGYTEHEGEKGAIRVMDPLRPHINYLRRELVTDMVRRSIDFVGVYAYALSVSRES